MSPSVSAPVTSTRRIPVPNITWYGPLKGEGSVDDVVSHTAEVHDALRIHANALALSAEFLLDVLPKHRTGDAQIGVQQAKLDYWVYMHDPQNFMGAKSIEDGHWVNGYGEQRRRALGESEGPIKPEGRHHWVPGLHPMQKAVDHAVQNAKVR